MNLISYLLIATATALPQSKVEMLSGTTHTGQLSQLNNEHVVVSIKGKEVTLPLKDVLSLTTDQKKKESQAVPLAVTLLDGTLFKGTQISTAKRSVTLLSPTLGEVVFPVNLVHHIQFKPSEGAITSAWQKLTDREIKQDLLIIQKGNVLDHLEGTIGSIDEKTIQFLLDGNAVPLSRKKVFGIIFARGSSKAPKTICDLTLFSGERLKLKTINLTEKGLESTLASGVDVTIPLDQVELFDFSLGKVMYLSQTKPRNVEFTSFLGYEYSYRNNKNDAGQLLKLDKTYSRGLWIHSKTELTYRIKREYRRFQATIGIDRNLTNYRQGHVHVVIRGDDKILFEKDVKGADKPLAIDLPIEKVLDLEILVDYGPNGDSCDHFDMINAKVLK